MINVLSTNDPTHHQRPGVTTLWR